MVLSKSINQKNYMEYSEYSCLENNKIRDEKINLFTDCKKIYLYIYLFIDQVQGK